MDQEVGATGTPGANARGPECRAQNAKRARTRTSDSELSLIERGPLAGFPRKPPKNAREYLTEQQILNIGNAFRFSEQLPAGYRLTLGLTIIMANVPSREDIGHHLEPSKYRAMLTSILQAIAKIAARKGIDLSYLYVWEASKKMGEHVHIMLNLPITMIGRVRALLRDHYGLTEKSGFQFSRGGWKNSSATDTGHGMLTPGMRSGFIKYVCKGYDPSAFRYYGADQQYFGHLLGLRYKKAGVVSGKRCGTSENLGQKARKLAGWTEITDLGELGSLLHQYNDTSDGAGKPFGRKKDARRGVAGRRAQAAPRRSGKRSAVTAELPAEHHLEH
ncbi:hypothetical protein [Dongia sp.]|uniref:hypothetical protein n=1 Tax=Dongia sp. TaxID=1977262 RepID=UPI0035B387D1